MSSSIAKSYTPSHPHLFIVEFREGAFSSFLKASKYFKAGEEITPLIGLVKGPKSWATVQCGPNAQTDHVNLNSDLVYLNHSCDPSVTIDLTSPNPVNWRVVACKDIKAGDPLTFFYPCTEWDMDQAFQCRCGSSDCLGLIQGAIKLPLDAIEKRGIVNPWIVSSITARRDPKSPKSKL